VIHQRLNEAGITISYRRLTVYRGRIQRGKSAAKTKPVEPQPASAPAGTEPKPESLRTSRTFDPLANLREQEKKQAAWQYPSGPPDESKLVG
jgi:hypothetical protein